jgi:hypothetical protein
MWTQQADLECGGKAVRDVALDPEDEGVIRARVHIGQGEPHAQFCGLRMQTGMRQGQGGGGKPVPEMQRVAVHHRLRGAGQGQVRPAAGLTGRRLPGPPSGPGPVEIVQDHLLARRAPGDGPVGAAGGCDQGQQGQGGEQEAEEFVHAVSASLWRVWRSWG